MQVAAGDRERVGQRGEHALGDDGRLARVGDVLELEQHGELVAAHARDGVARAQRGVEPQRDGLQQPVAGLVAERVVDDLEAVEVEEQHGGAGVRLAAARAAQGLLEPVDEERAVGEAGQRVVQRVVLQALDGAAVVGGVADGAHERVRVERRLRQVVDGAGRARRLDGVGAARVAEHHHLGARVLLQQLADRRRVRERRVEQDRVVRMLPDGGERRVHARGPVHVGGGGVDERADQAAIGLVRRDEEDDEGWLGHGPGSDSKSVPKPEQ